MILQALNEYYYRLLENPASGIAPPGYSLVDVSFVLVLSEQGVLLDVFSIEKKELVPEHKKRSGKNPPPYFLCDKALYSLGISGDKAEGEKRFNVYKEYNLKLLELLDCIEAKAVSMFLKTWEPAQWHSNKLFAPYEEMFNKAANYNFVYKIDGFDDFVHHNQLVKEVWEKSTRNKTAIMGQCLVTGQFDEIARTHDVPIKNTGGQSAGTALVSFNIDSFTSYGKTQSYNAPVSRKAAFAYATALNYLIASTSNKVRLSDTTMVFWADKAKGKDAEEMLSWWLDPVEVAASKDDAETGSLRQIAPEVINQAKTILDRAKSGLPIGDTSISPDTRFYLLGLAPNVARLSVRFWEVSSFGDLVGRIGQHYKDLDICGLDRIGSVVGPFRILKDLAVQNDSKNIPPLLGGQLMHSILTGRPYPQTLYNAMLGRCRAGGENGKVTTIRAAVAKAFLLRKYRVSEQKEKEALITVGLNENNMETSYLLGRLFSLLEKAQRDALGNGINATIRDRYFGAASATPVAVFPLLMRLSRHHISKATYGNLLDKKIQGVVNGLASFPAHLNLEEQGLFILGYYHQNQANYDKKENSGEAEQHG